MGGVATIHNPVGSSGVRCFPRSEERSGVHAVRRSGLPARPALRDRIGLHVQPLRPVRQVATGSRLVPNRRGVRPTSGRGRRDGAVRHPRQACLDGRGLGTPANRPGLRVDPDSRGPTVLLQRRSPPVGRGCPATGVHLPDPGGVVAVGDDPPSPRGHDAGRSRVGARRRDRGARRRQRRADQRNRSGLGPGRGRLRGLLLPDVGPGGRRRVRPRRRRPGHRWTGGRGGRHQRARRHRGSARDLHHQRRGHRRNGGALDHSGAHGGRGRRGDRLHPGYRRGGPATARLRLTAGPERSAIRCACRLGPARRGHQHHPSRWRRHRAGRSRPGTPGSPQRRGHRGDLARRRCDRVGGVPAGNIAP